MARSSDVEYKMRMTQDLKEKIVASAKEHNRSMNADIVARLEESFPSTDLDEIYKGYIHKKISNLSYIIERLDLQIGQSDFLIQTNKNTPDVAKKWEIIQEYKKVELKFAIDELKRIINENKENLRLPSIEDDTQNIMSKWIELQKAP